VSDAVKKLIDGTYEYKKYEPKKAKPGKEKPAVEGATEGVTEAAPQVEKPEVVEETPQVEEENKE